MVEPFEKRFAKTLCKNSALHGGFFRGFSASNVNIKEEKAHDRKNVKENHYRHSGWKDRG
jgi:hypothetical protein